MVANDKSPRPDPRVNNNGIMLNWPAFPSTMMISRIPYALTKVR